MSIVTVRVFFHDIDYVSDRTARDTIRALSKAMRRAQSAEVLYLLGQANLPLSQYQSLSDRALEYLTDVPMLDIQSAQQGSWKITAVVGAFGLWFIQNTVGESVKDGYKETEIHETIKDYVSGNRGAKLGELLREDGSRFSERWIIRSVGVKNKKGETRLIMHLVPSEGMDIGTREFVTDTTVRANVPGSEGRD